VIRLIAPELCAVQVRPEAVVALRQGKGYLSILIRFGREVGVGLAIEGLYADSLFWASLPYLLCWRKPQAAIENKQSLTTKKISSNEPIQFFKVLQSNLVHPNLEEIYMPSHLLHLRGKHPYL